MFGVTCDRFLVSTHSGTQVFRCKNSLAEEHSVVEVVWLGKVLGSHCLWCTRRKWSKGFLCKQFLVRISGVKIGVQGAAKQSKRTNCSIHSASCFLYLGLLAVQYSICFTLFHLYAP